LHTGELAQKRGADGRETYDDDLPLPQFNKPPPANVPPPLVAPPRDATRHLRVTVKGEEEEVSSKSFDSIKKTYQANPNSFTDVRENYNIVAFHL
jgi:hypothetical protein